MSEALIKTHILIGVPLTWSDTDVQVLAHYQRLMAKTGERYVLHHHLDNSYYRGGMADASERHKMERWMVHLLLTSDWLIVEPGHTLDACTLLLMQLAERWGKRIHWSALPYSPDLQ